MATKNKNTRPRMASPFTGGVPKRPTKKHRPAIWENMLGTVWALNSEGIAVYFDYNWDAARAHAGIDLNADQDLRLARFQGHVSYVKNSSMFDPKGPSKGQMVLWIKD